MRMLTEMEHIQLRLKNGYGIQSEIIHNDNVLNGCSDNIVVLVCAPHDEYPSWLLRMSPSATFDRWSNSCCIEQYFSTWRDLYFYLDESADYIYRQLFNSLSDDYRFLEAEHDELNEDWLRKCDDIDRKDSYIRYLEED